MHYVALSITLINHKFFQNNYTEIFSSCLGSLIEYMCEYYITDALTHVKLMDGLWLVNRKIQLRSTPVKRLCGTHNIITVNGQFPGPTLHVRNGDKLKVKVHNQAQYNATIHWYVSPVLHAE